MFTLNEQCYHEVVGVLTMAGRADLVEQITWHEDPSTDYLTSSQVARLLGVRSRNTVKNWLEGGFFPGAHKTGGGHWRFPREEVEAVKRRIEALGQKNVAGDLAPPDVDDDCQPPLL